MVLIHVKRQTLFPLLLVDILQPWEPFKKLTKFLNELQMNVFNETDLSLVQILPIKKKGPTEMK